MGSTSSPPEYWGYLIKADKSPSAIFEQLLLGIANYINRQIAPWDIDSLTPTKLAAFYRLVGGDHDPLFLETPHASLSFIYQSLGCFHTLQQEKSPYAAPSEPALTPQGFVRWQTVQLLLEPDEHVPFLQNAVKRLDIINPADGAPFPNPLPREALPSRPDPEMVQWHEGVANKLMADSRAIENGGLSTGKHAEVDSSTTTSSIASSLDDHSIMGTARYLIHPRTRPPFRPPPSIDLPQAIDAPLASNAAIQPPWELNRRRSSTSDIRSAASSSRPRDNPTPTSFSAYDNPHHHRPRSPSTVSTSSVSSSSSSITASSASVSPRLSSSHHHRRHEDSSELQRPHHNERRLLSHAPVSPRAASQPRATPVRPPPNGYLPPQQPVRQAGSNSRGLNVRWGDANAVANAVRRPLQNQDQRPASAYVEPRKSSDELYRRTRRSRNGREGRSTSPLRGVGGRKYAAEGINWN